MVFRREKRLLNRKSIKYRAGYVKDFLIPIHRWLTQFGSGNLMLDKFGSNITCYGYKWLFYRLHQFVTDAPWPFLPDLPFSVQAKSAASALVESIYIQHDYWNIQSIILTKHEGKMPSGSVESRPPIAFEEIEHTADRALRIYGRNLPELLLNAAGGLNSLMGAVDDIDSVQEKKSVEIEAMDAESLLVEWLSELAYWAETEMLVFSKFDLQNVSPTPRSATPHGAWPLTGHHGIRDLSCRSCATPWRPRAVAPVWPW